MESDSIEYKSSFNDSVTESLAAFANTKGGIVWVGMDDTGNPVKGFKIGKETIQNWLNEILQPETIAELNSIYGEMLGIFGYAEEVKN